MLQAFQNLPEHKKSELMRIMNNTESQAQIQVMEDYGLSAEQYLKNEVEYSFTIDAFDDNIALKKSPI